MKIAIPLLLLGACTDDAPTSSATLSTDATVLFSHANVSIVSHGAADQAYTISLTTQDGCLGGTTPVKFEIDLLANGTTLQPSTIPIRTTDTPDVLPSALFFPAAPATTVSGNLVVTSATADRIEGTGMVMTSAGPLTLAFSALVCSPH